MSPCSQPALLVLAILLTAGAAQASQFVTEPFLGVRRIHRTEISPRPLNINVVEVDLTAAGISFMVTPRASNYPGPNINGQPGETIRQTPRQFANGVGAQIAINASFYAALTAGGVHWANNLGLTASNGDAYSPWEASDQPDFRDALNIQQDNQAMILKRAPPTGFNTNPPGVPLYNAIAGSHRLVLDGVNQSPTSGAGNPGGLEPRTAVGLTAGNTKLIMMTIDGRQNGFSQGVTATELANYMIQHGAYNAINLDGGGSSQMVIDFYDDGQAALVVNSPSEAERMVGSNLAVFANRPGDYNGDGVVDGSDRGDFNGDGAINSVDYVFWRKNMGQQWGYDVWRNHFGAAAGGGLVDAAFVPEPSTLLLATFILCALPARGQFARRGC